MGDDEYPGDPRASTISVMSTVQEISDAIADRIRQAQGQISSLEAARSVLVEPDAPAASAAPPRARRAPVTPPTVKPSRPKRSLPTRRSGDLVAGQLETLLRESADGLSLVALAARAEVSDAKVRDRLQELQRQGEVRNSGSRRTSLWRLVSDEERIAERAAELQRASGARTSAGA
jgi:hypothetical protein